MRAWVRVACLEAATTTQVALHAEASVGPPSSAGRVSERPTIVYHGQHRAGLRRSNLSAADEDEHASGLNRWGGKCVASALRLCFSDGHGRIRRPRVLRRSLGGRL